MLSSHSCYCDRTEEAFSKVPQNWYWVHVKSSRSRSMRGKHLVRLKVCLRNSCCRQGGGTLERETHVLRVRMRSLNKCPQQNEQALWYRWLSFTLACFFFSSVKRETRFSLCCRHGLANFDKLGSCVYKIRKQKL